jgi:hypothetical protein
MKEDPDVLGHELEIPSLQNGHHAVVLSSAEYSSNSEQPSRIVTLLTFPVLNALMTCLAALMPSSSVTPCPNKSFDISVLKML